VDFTREPVIETVITPREGCKLVVRSSKSTSQEEYFVDAVEVVSFGSAFFYRSLEKPKSFLLPVIDYEILEVREARMVLKHVGSEKSIKIGGGRTDKEEKKPSKKEAEEKPPKKKERRRQQRRRRSTKAEENQTEKIDLPKPTENIGDAESPAVSEESSSKIIRSLLSSPPPLISETINQYRESYSQAFYERGEDSEDDQSEESVQIHQPEEEHSDMPQEEATQEAELQHAEESQEPRKSSILKDLWNFSDD
jgi:hypothetical protein